MDLTFPEEKNLKPIEEISLTIKNINHDLASIRNDIQYIKILIHANELKIENDKTKKEAGSPEIKGWWWG